MSHGLHRWAFAVEDFEDALEYLGPDGETIDHEEAAARLWIGTPDQAEAEANRRADRWEERNNCVAAHVKVYAAGEVRPLPADMARCVGVELPGGTFRSDCIGCRRRTDRTSFPLAEWTAPPEESPCPIRIGQRSLDARRVADGTRATGAGIARR